MRRPTPAASPSLRTQAVKGVAFTGAQSVIARVVLLFSQIALGWFLSPSDFGISALAGTCVVLAWTFENTGTDEVLLQRGWKIHKWERTVFFLSLWFAVGAMLALMAVSPLVARLFKTPEITLLLCIAAITIPIASLTTVPSVKMRHAMDFKWFAGINLVSVFVLQGLTVMFAMMGFGALSFFVPIPIAQIVRLSLFWYRSRPELSGRVDKRQVKATLTRSARVFFTRVAESILDQADYFVLGLMAVTGVVGVYNFAFRLAAVPVRVLSVNLRAVLVPMLLRLHGDSGRQRRASLEAAEMLAFIIAPMCFFLAAIAQPALFFLFGDKWLVAVLPMQILCIGLPAEAVLGIARAHMSARGEFDRAMRYAMVSVVIFVLMTSIGAWAGNLYGRGDVGVAISVSAYLLTVSPIIFFRVFPARGEWASQITNIFLRPFGFSALAAGTAMLAVRQAPVEWHALVIIVATLSLASAVLWVLLWIGRRHVHDLLIETSRMVLSKI